MTTLQIRIDETLREKAAATAHGMGLDLSTAVRMFLAQMVKENGLPRFVHLRKVKAEV